MEAKKLYFMDCHMAGRMYHDADEVWDNLVLVVGTGIWVYPSTCPYGYSIGTVGK